jgi:hypothetical protein
MKLIVPATAALAALLSCASANAAQFVVIEARGIAMRPGTTLDASKALVLKQGQHVTLISDSGATFSLDGPYNQPPAAGQSQGVDIAATLKGLGTETQSRKEAGVVRGGAGKVTLPDPWLLDASRTGNVCLREGEQAVFWRPQATTSAQFTIMPADRSWRADAPWTAGSDRLTIVGEARVHGDATYYVSFNGQESAISINTVPALLANDKMRAAWMAEKGCEPQAEAVLRTR